MARFTLTCRLTNKRGTVVEIIAREGRHGVHVFSTLELGEIKRRTTGEWVSTRREAMAKVDEVRDDLVENYGYRVIETPLPVNPSTPSSSRAYVVSRDGVVSIKKQTEDR